VDGHARRIHLAFPFFNPQSLRQNKTGSGTNRVTYSRCAWSLQLPVLYLFAVTGISQSQLVAAIAPIIPIHSSVANNESIIVDIPMTTSANAAAPEDIPYTRSARPSAIPAAISGVVAVYKFAAFIIRVAENPTAAMTSSPALAQSCCWKNHRQQYGKNNH
jgi:hypothetical protein